MSLRGHKGVRKSTFSKCSNWAETWLKVCVWHPGYDILTIIKHTLSYKMTVRDHKGVRKSKCPNWAET